MKWTVRDARSTASIASTGHAPSVIVRIVRPAPPPALGGDAAQPIDAADPDR